MNRLLQVAALCLSLGLLSFVACRAQSTSTPAPKNDDPGLASPDAGVDAAPPPPEVFLPASKSGGMFLEHQQAPR